MDTCTHTVLNDHQPFEHLRCANTPCRPEPPNFIDFIAARRRLLGRRSPRLAFLTSLCLRASCCYTSVSMVRGMVTVLRCAAALDWGRGCCAHGYGAAVVHVPAAPSLTSRAVASVPASLALWRSTGPRPHQDREAHCARDHREVLRSADAGLPRQQASACAARVNCRPLRVVSRCVMPRPVCVLAADASLSGWLGMVGACACAWLVAACVRVRVRVRCVLVCVRLATGVR